MYLHQSSLYKKYILSLRWNAETVDGSYVYYKKFPLLGGFVKIQRPKKLPAISKLVPFLHNIGVNKISVEPEYSMDRKKFSAWCRKLSKHVTLNTIPNIPTKTILIDITTGENDIFRRFAEAKRRAVRRAQKNNIVVRESNDIRDLMAIKNKSGGLFGFVVTWGIEKLWPIFAPKNAAILLAYCSPVIARSPDPIGVTWQSLEYKLKRLLRFARNDNVIVGGILLLFWNKTAYYWIAGATRKGKKLFAPTLLVWEALKLSKARGCRNFDFVGVWDERNPNYGGSWKGFTKFKEGFGGKEIYYPFYRQ